MECALQYSWLLCALLLTHIACEDDIDLDIEKCDNLNITGCSCTFLGVIFGVVCDNNEADISTLPNNLDSIFGVNNTYEITLQNLPGLPARVIQGLIVFRLIFDDPETAEISESAFEGVIRLRWFHVYLSSLTRIPNFKPVPHSLRQVNIDNSLLTKVQGEFQNLPLLTRLSLRNNTIETIDADAFEGSTAIEYLELSHNRIVSLPEKIFDELKNIIKLALSYNNLHTVEGLLKNVGTKLKFLNLEFNNLTDASEIISHTMPVLETLSLNNNPLRELDNTTFKGTVPKLRFISLDHCNFTEFRVDVFRYLEKLSSLDLSGNQIKHISNDSMDFGHNFDLILNGNQMESFDGGITFRTKRLFLTDNSLRRLGTTLQFTQLTEVDISRNRLVAVEVQDFQGAHSTENMAFRENEIENIDWRCFEAFQNSIHTLDLSDNRLTSLNRSVQYLSQLKALNVSFNFLETLDDEEFVGLNELSELYIQNNRIVVLRGQIQTIPRLQYLILQNNAIKQLDMKQVPRTLQYLYIKGNPLKCNCELYLKFLKKLKKTPQLDGIICAPNNASENLYQPCPSSCACNCKSDVNASFVSVDCGSRYLTSVPSTLSNWSIVSSPPDGVYRIDDPTFTVYDRTLSLNLANNSIGTLEGVSLSRNLKELYLANNTLTSLPYSIMNLPKLRQVTLAGNQWTCDCDDGKTVEFRKWLLSKNNYVQDVNQTRCYDSKENKELIGKVIVAAAEADLCPSEIGMYITLTFSVLCLLLLIAAMKITYTRYELNIKVWLYSKGVTFVKEKDIDRDKRFDAFLSFSHMDQDFVTKDIINAIERSCPNINLCIHYRHFVPGKFIHENIMDAVNNSKRTVLILTKNFLESEWCMMEFRAADVQNIKDKVRRVIVIKIGDLPPDMDPSIKVYLDSTTYLTWGEKYFWQKLIYALPKPSPYPISSQSAMTLLS